MFDAKFRKASTHDLQTVLAVMSSIQLRRQLNNIVYHAITRFNTASTNIPLLNEFIGL